MFVSKKTDNAPKAIFWVSRRNVKEKLTVLVSVEGRTRDWTAQNLCGMKSLVGRSNYFDIPKADPDTIISSMGPLRMKGVTSAMGVGWAETKTEGVHLAKKLDFVAIVVEEYNSPFDGLRETAGVVAGVLYPSSPLGNTVLYSL